jgi:hypothetical protein
MSRVRLDLTKHNRNNALASVPALILPERGKETNASNNTYITYETTKEIRIPLQLYKTKKTLLHTFELHLS